MKIIDDKVYLPIIIDSVHYEEVNYEDILDENGLCKHEFVADFKTLSELAEAKN